MYEKKVWVVGHRNPDTDSICAAIAYAELKNKAAKKEGNATVRFVPSRAGEVNAETAYVLNHFGVEEPEYIADVGTQIRDIAFKRTEGISSHLSMKGYFVKGKVVVTTGSAQITFQTVEKDDLVIVGDNEETQLVSIEAGCSCIIITNGLKINDKVIEKAKRKDVVIISSPYDSFTVARLINQSMPIKSFMTKKENVISFELDDYVDMEEATTLIYYGEDAAGTAKEAFGCAPQNNGFLLKGVVSRKKQLIPALMNALTERMY